MEESTRNSKRYGVANGSLATVTEVDVKRQILTVKLDYDESTNVDAQMELGMVVCIKCRQVPQLVELLVDRQPKNRSSIIVPGAPDDINALMLMLSSMNTAGPPVV